MSKIKTISLYLLGILLVLAGINHFIMAEEVYLKIMPPYLGWHKELVFLSGLIEIGLGVLLLVPQYRKIAAWGIILLLIAVFPANIYLAQTNGAVLGVSPLVAWGRLPLQILFLLWAWWFTKDENGKKSSAKSQTKTGKRR